MSPGRPRASTQATQGGVSIVIPSKDNPVYLSNCVASLYRTANPLISQVIVVDSGSITQEAKVTNELLAQEYGVELIVCDQRGIFNFPQLVNVGAEQASGDKILLLNDDTEIVESEWLSTMAGSVDAAQGRAVTGALLCYPDLTVQHGGVEPDPIYLSRHVGKDVELRSFREDTTHQGVKEAWAVTGAALLTSTALWQRLGGFDERLGVSYNDIDFCLRARQEGALILIAYSAMLIHFESKSRGHDAYEYAKARRHLAESQRFGERWREEFLGRGVNIDLAFDRLESDVNKLLPDPLLTT